jgi:hypothetical protein
MSTLLAALRRSPRLSNHPLGVVAPVPSRRSNLWELEPSEASPERGSAAGQAALRGEGLPAEDHSEPSDPRFETIGINISKGEGGLSDQVASDEALGELVVDFLDTVRKGYANDPFLSCAKDDNQFVLHHGLYWRAHQLVIPDYQGLRRKCLEASHDAPWAGHFGRDKTGALVTSMYWWPKIQEDVADYVLSCPSCERSKPVQHKPFGLLVPVQIPERRWSSIGSDFIIHLPITTTGHGSIVVFVDRLIKRVHIEPCHDTTSAQEFAEIFPRTIFKQHWLPLDIVSDRDSRFTSHFWTEVCKHLGIKKNMSTAFHPRSAGLTERVNRILEEVLRAYIADDHSDRDEHLPLVEFAVNNSVNSATGTTPFLMDCGQAPLTPSMASLATARKDIFPFVGNCGQPSKLSKPVCTMHSIATSNSSTSMLQTRNLSLETLFSCLPRI